MGELYDDNGGRDFNVLKRTQIEEVIRTEKG